MKDLQAFLGTANYVRAHAGPALEQLDAVEGLKKLVLEDHVLAVPDEFAAIAAANRWLQNESPGGRPYETAADTFGYAIGGVTGQCVKDGGKLKALAYYSAHLSPCPQKGHPFEQEFWGLLCARRDMVKHLGMLT